MRTLAKKPKPTQQTASAKRSATVTGFFGQIPEENPILHLQRTIGNRAVQRWLKHDGDELHEKPTTPASTGFGRDFSPTPEFNSSSVRVQPKLKVSAPGDRYEREADRVAEKVMRHKTPEGEQIHRIETQAMVSQQETEDEHGVNVDPGEYISRSKPGGHSIPREVRTFFERHMRTDLGDVRIHADSESAQINKDLGSQAFTYGDHIYFGAGNYNPRTTEGNSLLAHELTHVMQQGGGNLRINRKDESAPSSAPEFSVATATYEKLVRRAVLNLTGRLLGSTTFAPLVQPILQSMLAQVVWRDSAGNEQGGAAVKYTVPGTRGTALDLTMILDDMKDPPEAGKFQPSGTSGRLSIRVRKSPTVEDLTEVLYHESMHMMSWMIAQYGTASAPGIEKRAVRGLELGRFSTQIAAIRRELDNLASPVNARRRATGTNQVTAKQLDQTARWLMEEVQVRAETEVFQLALQVEQQRRARARVYTATQPYGSINLQTVNRYIFEFSHAFTAGDRKGMTEDERRILRRLTEMLEGFFQIHVRRRFSLTAHTISIPRTRPEFSPRPLKPPSFIERIGEATRREPF